jgi:hypothetical protein
MEAPVISTAEVSKDLQDLHPCAARAFRVCRIALRDSHRHGGYNIPGLASGSRTIVQATRSDAEEEGQRPAGSIDRPNQVWAAHITYVPIAAAFSIWAGHVVPEHFL